MGLEVCSTWDEPGARVSGDVDITESSGVAASAVDGVFVTIADAANDAVIYRFDREGASLGQQLVAGATNTDWEDIAAAPCPDGGDCLWVADIGDNDESRETVTVWILPDTDASIVDATACTLSYEDGPRDAEAILVGDGIRVVTKEADGEAKVYLADCDAGTLSREVELTLGEAVTGGVMTDAGPILRTATTAWSWQACSNWTWGSAPLEIALASDAQGEGIGWDGESLITTSEGAPFGFSTIACLEADPCDAACACSGANASVVFGLAVLFSHLRRQRRG